MAAAYVYRWSVRARSAYLLLRSWVVAHPRAIEFACAAAAALLAFWRAPSIGWLPGGPEAELSRPEDIHNIYYAARAASWRDIPRWWTGSWIYPHVPYYRPVTSMLFLAECHAFGTNFTAWDRVSVGLHVMNALLVYLLTSSLFRHHGLGRCLFGLLAVVFFATPANTMFFAVGRSLTWWPAQNDVLSLTFALLCLTLLDAGLVGRRPTLIGFSVLALIASVGSKEMGYITIPMALGLLLYRRVYMVSAGVTFLATGAMLWVIRRVCVPNAWGPVMARMVILRKWIHEWSGPLGSLMFAGIWWPIAAAGCILLLTAVARSLKWPAWAIVLADTVAACVCAQFVGPDGTWALVFVPDGFAMLLAVIMYLVAPWLFWRHRRNEPGIVAAALMLLSFLPILQYGGRHYFYWPGAFLAIADAAFAACLWREVRPLLQRAVEWALRSEGLRT